VRAAQQPAARGRRGAAPGGERTEGGTVVDVVQRLEGRGQKEAQLHTLTQRQVHSLTYTTHTHSRTQHIHTHAHAQTHTHTHTRYASHTCKSSDISRHTHSSPRKATRDPLWPPPQIVLMYLREVGECEHRGTQCITACWPNRNNCASGSIGRLRVMLESLAGEAV